MRIKKDPQQVFAAPKIHTRTRNIRLTIEISILILVLAGTIFSLLSPGTFSLSKSLENLKGLISLKRESHVAKQVPFEEQAKSLIDKKLVNITALETTADGSITIRSLEGVTVILSSQKDVETQARTLQTLLSKAKIEGKAVSLVDFRFDKLVVLYK